MWTWRTWRHMTYGTGPRLWVNNREFDVLSFFLTICSQAGRASTVTQDLFASLLPAETDELKAELTLCSVNGAAFRWCEAYHNTTQDHMSYGSQLHFWHIISCALGLAYPPCSEPESHSIQTKLLHFFLTMTVYCIDVVDALWCHDYQRKFRDGLSSDVEYFLFVWQIY